MKMSVQGIAWTFLNVFSVHIVLKMRGILKVSIF